MVRAFLVISAADARPLFTRWYGAAAQQRDRAAVLALLAAAVVGHARQRSAATLQLLRLNQLTMSSTDDLRGLEDAAEGGMDVQTAALRKRQQEQAAGRPGEMPAFVPTHSLLDAGAVPDAAVLVQLLHGRTNIGASASSGSVNLPFLLPSQFAHVRDDEFIVPVPGRILAMHERLVRRLSDDSGRVQGSGDVEVGGYDSSSSSGSSSSSSSSSRSSTFSSDDEGDDEMYFLVWRQIKSTVYVLVCEPDEAPSMGSHILRELTVAVDELYRKAGVSGNFAELFQQPEEFLLLLDTFLPSGALLAASPQFLDRARKDVEMLLAAKG